MCKRFKRFLVRFNYWPHSSIEIYRQIMHEIQSCSLILFQMATWGGWTHATVHWPTQAGKVCVAEGAICGGLSVWGREGKREVVSAVLPSFLITSMGWCCPFPFPFHPLLFSPVVVVKLPLFSSLLLSSHYTLLHFHLLHQDYFHGKTAQPASY